MCGNILQIECQYFRDFQIGCKRRRLLWVDCEWLAIKKPPLHRASVREFKGGRYLTQIPVFVTAGKPVRGLDLSRDKLPMRHENAGKREEFAQGPFNPWQQLMRLCRQRFERLGPILQVWFTQT
jgi:hypothetical protein